MSLARRLSFLLLFAGVRTLSTNPNPNPNPNPAPHQMTVSGRLMSGKSGRLDSFQMTFYTGPVAFIALTPFVTLAI